MELLSRPADKSFGGSPVEAAPRDGRHWRRERNRDAVVEAMLELFREGNLSPSADEIAERAAVSPRSVFRYFSDIDDLCRVAIAHQHARVRAQVEIDLNIDGPVGDRVTALVEQRLQLFDAIGFVGQVSRLREPFQPLIATELTTVRAFLRDQIATVFAVELEALDAECAAQRVAAADVLCSYEAYHLMRTDQGLTAAECSGTLTGALLRLFTP